VITISYSYSGTGVTAGSDTMTYGGGTCNSSVNIPIDPDEAFLNRQAPGTTYAIALTVSGAINGTSYTATPPGSFSIVEVPYARFYGNDIYATNGEIRFNDSNNSDTSYDERGAVVQYGALAFGTVRIDTSSFRTPVNPLPTQPPNGLDSAGSALANSLGAISSTRVYNDVISNLPDCSANPSNINALPAAQGCYSLIEDTSLNTNNARIGGMDGLGGATQITYNRKITLVNDIDRPLVINANLINNTPDYTNIQDTGVLLIVSRGDVIIDNSVERIDAIIVTNRNVYTCGSISVPNFVNSPVPGDLESVCRQSLNINGSVSARNILFQRAIGSRFMSPGLNTDLASGNAKCLAWAGIRNCNARGYATDGSTADQINTSGGAAELINFPAYLYFATPYLEDNGDSGAESDALFQAPPRL
jgi:hypothetical protein